MNVQNLHRRCQAAEGRADRLRRALLGAGSDVDRILTEMGSDAVCPLSPAQADSLRRQFNHVFTEAAAGSQTPLEDSRAAEAAGGEPDPAVIDRVARAICESVETDDWDELADEGVMKAVYRQQARAAIAAYLGDSPDAGMERYGDSISEADRQAIDRVLGLDFPRRLFDAAPRPKKGNQ